jgi:hypothetical protein
MARKLIYGNEILGFTPSTGIITARGYVPTSKLLLVNNSTNNTTLFNFSDPDTLAVCTYNSSSDTTTIDLSYAPYLNVGTLSSTDDLQIYYEREEVNFAPVDSLLDPVSKFRVSEPESLIDTDFEYSIQQTKWETVKLTNNIPTSFSLAATTNDPVVVATASVDANSDIVNVVTAEDHGLVAGSVVETTGFTDPSYEGTFVVTKVNTNRDFNYKVRFKSSSKKELSTIYSLVYPGAFYTGSGINILDITTNAAVASTLTVTFPANHGFPDNTKLYLKKSRATRLFKINSPTDVRVGASTMPSPTGTAQTTQYSLINSATTTNDNRYYAQRPIVIDDWIGRHEINIPGTSVNTTNGVITYTSTDQIGVAAGTTVVANDAIVFYTPIGNTLPGGITSFRGYYVFQTTAATDPVSGVTTSTLRFSDSWGSTTPVTPTSTGNTLYGNHRILVGKRVASIASNDRITFSTPHGFSVNQRLIAISSGTFSNVAKTTNNHITYTYYYVRQIISDTVITVSTTSGGTQANINSSSSTFTPAANNICIFAAVDLCPIANGFYLPPQAGFSTVSWTTGSYLLYRASGGVGYNQLGITTNTRYLVREINNNPNWYNLCLNTNTAINTPINITFTQTNAGNIYNGIHTFTTTYPIPDASSIEILDPPRAGYGNNELVQYSPDVGISTIGNLVGNSLYRVKVNDSTMVIQPGISTVATKFRLSETSSETKVYGVSYTKNSNFMDIYVANTAVVGYGISVGKMIQVSGVNDTLYNNNLINGLHYVTGISTATSGTWANRPRIRVLFPLNNYKNQFNNFSIAANATSLQNSSVTGIVSFSNAGGIGTHRFTLANDGAADDIYLIGNSIGTSFTLSSNVEIPEVVKTIQGGDGQIVGISSNWIRLTSHNYADGTQVSYATTQTTIGGLTNGSTYYVRVLDRNFIGLATEQTVALDRNNDESGLIVFSGAGSSVPHSFVSNSVKGFITGPGSIGFSTTSTLITGTSTKFLTDFSIGDLFRVYTLTAGNTGPGSYFESRIVKVNSNTALRILEIPRYNAGSGSANYFVPTRLYPISDGRIVHRPFDGGVNLSAGLVPNTQVVRQTRKYFRYQSGKGIQLSIAINFNPTFDIDTISVDGTIGISTVAIVNCKFPHGLAPNSVGSSQQVRISGAEGPYASQYNQLFDIREIVDDFKFKVAFSSVAPADPPDGFAQFNVVNWGDATVKAGMFDDQNGFFYKYDGSTLYAVRRTATQQISGQLTVDQTSNIITGTDTQFTRQLTSGSRLVIRGQTYKVIQVQSDNEIHVQPAYRGSSATDVVASIVKDIEVPQSEWNIDRCDGTGKFGYNLDLNKIQMAYMDYSWYGAGKIRFGFKDQNAEVKYVHEFIHNNKLTESYFRSGNMPARYEVETFDNPLFSPSLFHWGASVIMDGRFDDDKAYLFTADSNTLPFTNGGIANNGTGTRPVGTVSVGSTIITAISASEASTLVVGEEITIDGASAAQQYPAGTKIVGIEVDQSSTANKYSNVYTVITSKASNLSSSRTFNVTSGTSAALRSYIPLVSIRLAPSVDNGIIGNLGYRDIITRMQVNLKSAGILATHDCEAVLVLNPQLTNDAFSGIGNPSLSQIYKHEVGDTYTGGTVIYSFRAAGGSILNTTSGKRGLNNTSVELGEVALLGNSILGGDLTFPDGPDVLTVAVRPIDTSQITGSSPMIVSARITWAEAQS